MRQHIHKLFCLAAMVMLASAMAPDASAQQALWSGAQVCPLKSMKTTR